MSSTTRRRGTVPGWIEDRNGASPAANKWAVFVVIALGIFMATLDSSIVNISLPTIARHFQVGLSGTVEWVIIAYLVVVSATLLTIGRLADMVGRKPIWATGLVIFTIGSALCGASTSLPMLVAFRAFQGLGGSLLMAISPAMLTSAFPASERGRALGLNAVMVSLGVSAGPTLGGILTQDLTWRAIFYVNVPIGVVGLIAALKILRREPNRGRGRFDPFGAGLLAVGLAALTLGLSFGQEWGWTSPRSLASIFVGIAGLVATVLFELRTSDPILDFSLFRDRVFSSASFSQILSFLALFAVSFLLPFYLEELRGYSTIRAGLLLTPLPLSIAVVAPISGTLADRVGTRWLASIGLAVACGGLVLISFLTASTPMWQLVGTLMFTGVGQGLFQSPNNSAMLGAAPRGRQGVASGILATGRTVGQSISVALAGAIFAAAGAAAAGAQLSARAAAATAAGPSVADLRLTFQHGFRLSFIVCAAIAAVGIFTSLVRGSELVGA
ncbi:MAG TPA: DHA2 family efflux MFS transporter permease subunit [Thermomicrobiaceae bacterium]|nr:DHA2 family efflux MFS transporter permease subunit [Thermomicrobiaceae bacterium]